MFNDFNLKPLIAAMAAASLLTACGGGGGSDDNNTAGGGSTTNPGTTNPTPSNPDTNNPPVTRTLDPQRTTMDCLDGTNVQCSGETLLANENGVVLTNSGVQVLGASTNNSPTGLQLLDSSNAKADVRLHRAESGQATAASLLLENLGIKWGAAARDTERPQIVETFSTRAGRVEMINGVPTLRDLPDVDGDFYDFTRVGTGTKARYANNVYFPRGNTVCPTDSSTALPAGCETRGLQGNVGDFRLADGGGQPDYFGASRQHNDGDVHAGTRVARENTTTRGLTGPGSKGYRSLNGYNYNYVNLGAWTTQDTVEMAEWGGNGPEEHNTARRGAIAFGDVTNPAAVPTTGTATYTGFIHGYYGNSTARDPDVVRGTATVTVDFAARTMTVTVTNVRTFDVNNTAVDLLTGSNLLLQGGTGRLANYLTGSIGGTGNAGYAGGISARYFGPVASTGTSGAGPAELGGAVRFTTTGGAFVGAFIARKD